MDLLKTEPDACLVTCVTLSVAENQVISIKVECITDVEEDGDLKPATFVRVKTENEVSCLCNIIKHRSQISRTP
jgi:hypothetical protein